MSSQEQLLSILYDLSQTISSEVRLQPLLKKVLQRIMYHTGFPCGFIVSDEGEDDKSGGRRLQIAIGDRKLLSSRGEFLDLSAVLSALFEITST